jgi:hypothetical protein
LEISVVMNIWMYWRQGWEKAPHICRRCASSWCEKNPSDNVFLLDRDNVADYFNLDKFIDSSSKKISVQSYTDILRANLLWKYGGVWCDATVFCNKGLSKWMPTDSFFSFSSPTKDRMVSSWFMYAPKRNYVIGKWRSEVKNYWLERKHPDNYYWFHLLFSEIYKDPQVKCLWDKQIKISCQIETSSGPHFFWPYTKKRMEHISRVGVPVDIPVFKLRYNKNLESYSEIKEIIS